jgi:hypothetical protein
MMTPEPALPLADSPPPRRIPITLSGGPFDRAIIFAPEGAIEAGLERRGRFHVYEIKGRHGSYIGPRPIEED